MVRQEIVLLRDSMGSIEATGDYSVTADHFFAAPPPNETWEVLRFSVFMQDSRILSGGYGNLGALTNGIQLLFVDVIGPFFLIRDLLDGLTITSTPEWSFFAEISDRQAWGPGDETYYAHFEATNNSAPLLMRGSRNQGLAVRLSDDLSGLERHNFSIVIRRNIDTLLNSAL